jgi:hypothetical protein
MVVALGAARVRRSGDHCRERRRRRARHARGARLSSTAVGAVATVYLAGEMLFGRLSDGLGRRDLFMITLAV